MRCALRSHFLTISNGLGPQIDPVFLTKRGWNTQRSFRLFLDKKKNRAGNENGPKRIICSACSTVPKRTTRYPMLLVKSNDKDAWWSGKVKWPPPRQYQRRSLTIVRITRTSRTAVARWKSSSMSITITPTITITNENHHWLNSCCHLQPKLSNSSPGSIAVAALLTWSNQQTLWQVR